MQSRESTAELEPCAHKKSYVAACCLCFQILLSRCSPLVVFSGCAEIFSFPRCLPRAAERDDALQSDHLVLQVPTDLSHDHPSLPRLRGRFLSFFSHMTSDPTTAIVGTT